MQHLSTAVTLAQTPSSPLTLYVISFSCSAAAKVTGQSFYYLKGAAAALEVALVHYAMERAIAKVQKAISLYSVCRADSLLKCVKF